MLFHDNASAQSAIRQFVAQKMVAVLDHPSYSSDLAPADFFRFPRLKASIKSARSVHVNATKDHVTAILRTIPQEAFADCFRKVYEHCQKCVDADGDFLKVNKENLFVSFVF